MVQTGKQAELRKQKTGAENGFGKGAKRFSAMGILCALLAAAVLAAGCAGSSGTSSGSGGAKEKQQEQGGQAAGKEAGEAGAEDAKDKEGAEGAGGEEKEDEASGLRRALIEVEGYGTITVALDDGAAPATVENFVRLAEEGFYDGLTFHRIIDGFMIQGGDPNGNGTGGSDQTIVGEFASNGRDNPISHVKGVISMARAQDPDSASSQFFITVADSTFLDGDYAAFGYVTEGMEVAEKIAKDANPVDGNGTIPAQDQPVITSIRIAD